MSRWIFCVRLVVGVEAETGVDSMAGLGFQVNFHVLCAESSIGYAETNLGRLEVNVADTADVPRELAKKVKIKISFQLHKFPIDRCVTYIHSVFNETALGALIEP